MRSTIVTLLLAVFVTFGHIEAARAERDLMVMPATVGCEVAVTVRNRGTEDLLAENWQSPTMMLIRVELDGVKVYEQPITVIDPQQIVLKPRGQVIQRTGVMLPPRTVRFKTTAIGVLGDERPDNNAEEIPWVCPADVHPASRDAIRVSTARAPLSQPGFKEGLKRRAMVFNGAIIANQVPSPGFVAWELDGRVLSESQAIRNADGTFKSDCVWERPRPGRHTIRMIVDSRQQVAEIDENNNVAVLQFDVPGASTPPSRLRPSPKGR